MFSNHLVLAGGGHTHALILLRWAMNPHLRPKCMITLINRHSTNIYSSMFPGLISGKYKFDDILIDLRQLSSFAKVGFIKAEITGLNSQSKSLNLSDRRSIGFTHISLDVGSETLVDQENLKLIKENLAFAIKPFKQSFDWIQEKEYQFNNFKESPFTVIGSGLSAIEISFALRKRWPHSKLNLQIYEKQLNKTFRRLLVNSNINLVSEKKSHSGPSLLCTGSIAPKWLKASGLPVNDCGRVITSSTFQVIDCPDIFAVGDCAVIEKVSRPASGVWAVKAAKPLAKNIEFHLKGLKIFSWKPQNNALQLIGIEYQKTLSMAWAKWGPIILGPSSFLWDLKKFIDKRFMDKFNIVERMKSHQKIQKNSCRGCGSKISSATLMDSLEESGLLKRSNFPEDATLICSSLNGEQWVQSVDGFPALISDPWLNARLTALHACSDIWAVGASVKSVQAVISLPEVKPNLQAILLKQCLSGIKSVLDEQGASLIGGHTYESRNPLSTPISLGIEIALSVNGILGEGEPFFEKAGLQPNDHLLISRPLGSGVIFAAAMHGEVNTKDLDFLLSELTKSQHSCLKFENISNLPDGALINSCTDITGFGLLGHLGEMLMLSNRKRLSLGSSKLKIKLDAESIPSFPGVKDLFKKGYRSSLAPSNSDAWSLLKKNEEKLPLVDLYFNNNSINLDDLKLIKELIIDPQTCGPLIISCTSSTARYLTNKFKWIKIGLVEEIN